MFKSYLHILDTFYLIYKIENVDEKVKEETVENRIFAVSSPSNTRQNQFMSL